MDIRARMDFNKTVYRQTLQQNNIAHESKWKEPYRKYKQMREKQQGVNGECVNELKREVDSEKKGRYSRRWRKVEMWGWEKMGNLFISALGKA